MATNQQFQRIKHILDEATPLLSDSLEPTRILRALKSKHILNDSEVASIKNDPQQDARVDMLLVKLKRKEPRAYEIFLDALREEREDLYTSVKKIEAKYDSDSSANKAINHEKQNVTPAMIKDGKVTDRDIRCVTRKVKLLRNQLKDLYKELGLEDHEIENAERTADTMDYKLQGDKVLLHWRSKNGRDAKRSVIIHCLKECDYEDEAQALEDMWKI